MNEDIINTEGFKNYIETLDSLDALYRDYYVLYARYRELLNSVNDFIETDASGAGMQETVIKLRALKDLIKKQSNS